MSQARLQSKAYGEIIVTTEDSAASYGMPVAIIRGIACGPEDFPPQDENDPLGVLDQKAGTIIRNILSDNAKACILISASPAKLAELIEEEGLTASEIYNRVARYQNISNVKKEYDLCCKFCGWKKPWPYAESH
jgi:hypothetical protein